MFRACICVLLLATVACGRKAEAPPPPTSAAAAKSDPAVDGMLKGSADAILAKDYARADEAIAMERRPSLPLSEFKEAISHYRAGYESPLQVSIRVSSSGS